MAALRKACEHHVKLTKECSQGLGQDRHLYALYCLLQRQFAGNLNPSPDDPVPWPPHNKMPAIFTDPGWELLSTSILSTSNCGNPALRLFGFGPVAADGYGIGYIIKEYGISMYVPTRSYCWTKDSQMRIVEASPNPSFPRHATRVSSRYPTIAHPDSPRCKRTSCSIYRPYGCSPRFEDWETC